MQVSPCSIIDDRKMRSLINKFYLSVVCDVNMLPYSFVHFSAYANLISSFWKDKSNASSYVNPSSFKSQIQKFAPRFTGYQ